MNAHSFVRRTSLTILMVVAVANSATGEVLFKESFDDPAGLDKRDGYQRNGR